MRKNVNIPIKIVSAASMSADYTSTPFNIQYQDNVAIQVNITTSDAIGPVYIQGSLDYVPAGVNIANGVPNAGNWVTLTLNPQPAAAGANDVFLYDLNQLSFPWIRIFFDRTSGTGTFDAYLSTKEV